MASKTTTRTSYKDLTEYYSTAGFSFQIKNHGPGVAKAKVIEIFDDEYTLSPGECVTHMVVGYASVKFKSRDGVEVTVESVWGECPKLQFSDTSTSAPARAEVLEPEQLTEETKELVKKLTEAQRVKAKLKGLLDD
jgi:hypothetical protein